MHDRDWEGHPRSHYVGSYGRDRDEDWRRNDWRGDAWRADDWRGNDWRGNDWRGNDWRGNDWRGDDWRGVRRDDVYGSEPAHGRDYGRETAGYGLSGYRSEPMMPREPRRYPRGPKGYKRSDERIKEDACDSLYRADDIDSSDVEVAVQNGEITLTGTVPDRHMKFMVENICERVTAVTDITNNLRIKRYAESPPLQTQERSSQSYNPIGPMGENDGRRNIPGRF